MALSGKIPAGSDFTFTLANEGTVAMVDAVTDITGPKFTGQLCFNRTGNDLYRWDGTQWVVINATRVCTADSPAVNNSVVLVSSTFLTVPVGTNTSYSIETNLIYTAAAVADIKFGLAVPAGTGAPLWSSFGSPLAAAVTDATIFHDAGAFGTVSYGALGVGTQFTCRPCIFFTTGGTPGNAVIQFAQNAADPSNAVLKAGSWMRVTAA